MKKFILPLVAVALLSACGESSSGDATEEDKETAVKTCMSEFKKGLGDNAAMFDMEKLEPIAQEYCECSIDKLIEADIPVSEMNSMSESDIMEVAADCFAAFQEDMMGAINMEAAME